MNWHRIIIDSDPIKWMRVRVCIHCICILFTPLIFHTASLACAMHTAQTRFLFFPCHTHQRIFNNNSIANSHHSIFCACYVPKWKYVHNTFIYEEGEMNRMMRQLKGNEAFKCVTYSIQWRTIYLVFSHWNNRMCEFTTEWIQRLMMGYCIQAAWH